MQSLQKQYTQAHIGAAPRPKLIQKAQIKATIQMQPKQVKNPQQKQLVGRRLKLEASQAQQYQQDQAQDQEQEERQRFMMETEQRLSSIMENALANSCYIDEPKFMEDFNSTQQSLEFQYETTVHINESFFQDTCKLLQEITKVIEPQSKTMTQGFSGKTKIDFQTKSQIVAQLQNLVRAKVIEVLSLNNLSEFRIGGWLDQQELDLFTKNFNPNNSLSIKAEFNPVLTEKIKNPWDLPNIQVAYFDMDNLYKEQMDYEYRGKFGQKVQAPRERPVAIKDIVQTQIEVVNANGQRVNKEDFVQDMDTTQIYSNPVVGYLLDRKIGEIIDIPQELDFKKYINMDVKGLKGVDQFYMRVTILNLYTLEYDEAKIDDMAIRKKYPGFRTRKEFEIRYAQDNSYQLDSAYDVYLSSVFTILTMTLQQAYHSKCTLSYLKYKARQDLVRSIQSEEDIQRFVEVYQLNVSSNQLQTMFQQEDYSVVFDVADKYFVEYQNQHMQSLMEQLTFDRFSQENIQELGPSQQELQKFLEPLYQQIYQEFLKEFQQQRKTPSEEDIQNLEFSAQEEAISSDQYQAFVDQFIVKSLMQKGFIVESKELDISEWMNSVNEIKKKTQDELNFEECLVKDEDIVLRFLRNQEPDSPRIQELERKLQNRGQQTQNDKQQGQYIDAEIVQQADSAKQQKKEDEPAYNIPLKESKQQRSKNQHEGFKVVNKYQNLQPLDVDSL